MKRLISTLLFLSLAACDKAPEPVQGQTSVIAPVTTGVVLETMDVESYTYVKLGAEGREFWLATSPTMVAQGDTLRFSGGVLMQDFHSATLDRTFDQILFVGSVEVVDGPAQAGARHADQYDPHAGLNLPVAASSAPVEVVMPEGATSIAEVFAEPERFMGQPVTVHGKVVKVSSNIMNKNWLTLEDGTGVAPDNQLLVTTQLTASLGDELTVTGVLRTDVDLGYGYQYKVLLEDAATE